jgi:hypothetical protein
VKGRRQGGLGDICKIDPERCPTIDMDKAAKRPLDAEMYAVQQIYALRYHRFEINPTYGLTMNDQFVVTRPSGSRSTSTSPTCSASASTATSTA